MIQENRKYNSEEFFELTKDSKKRQELRKGRIFSLASPSLIHQNIVLGLGSTIRTHIKNNKGICRVVIAPFDVKLSENDVVIPDVAVICDTSKLDEKRCNGSPDWIIEVLSTNRKDDLIYKFQLYQHYGVREYWIVDPKFNRTVVYFFEEEHIINFYSFDDDIPVGIYDGKLKINIAQLLSY